MIRFLNKKSGLDTSDATATASDIVKPKTAYINGEKVTGNIATSGHYANIQSNVESISKNCTNFCITNDMSYLITFGDTIDIIEISTGETAKTISKNDLSLSTENIRGVYISNVPFEGNKYYLVFTTSKANTAYVDVCDIDITTLNVTKLYQKTISIEYNGFIFAMSKSHSDICAITTRTFVNTYRITQSDLTVISNVSFYNERLGNLDFQKKDTILVSNGNYIHDNRHYTYYAKLNSNFEIVFCRDYSNDNTNIAFFNNSNKCLKINTDQTITLCDYVDNGNSFTITETDNVWELPSNKSKNVYINDLDNLLITQDYINGKVGIFKINSYTNIEPTLLAVFDGTTEYYDLGKVVPFWLGNNFVASLKNGIIKICDFDYGSLTVDKMIYDNKIFHNPYNANATKTDIIETKIAYNENGVIKGTIPNNGALSYTPGEQQQTIPAGYTSGGTIANIMASSDYQACLGLSNDILNGTPIYTELEYVQSAGSNQYINTGVIPTNKIEFEIKYNHVQTAEQYETLLGGQQGSTGIFFMNKADNNTSKKSFRYNSSESKVTPSGTYYNTDVIAKLEDNVFTLDNGQDTPETFTVGSFSNFNGTKPIWLFALNNGGNVFGSIKAKVYYFKIWDNGTLVRHFIPVKDIQNVVCMYDLVNDEYYYPSTGTLIGGAAV